MNTCMQPLTLQLHCPAPRQTFAARFGDAGRSDMSAERLRDRTHCWRYHEVNHDGTTYACWRHEMSAADIVMPAEWLIIYGAHAHIRLNHNDGIPGIFQAVNAGNIRGAPTRLFDGLTSLCSNCIARNTPSTGTTNERLHPPIFCEHPMDRMQVDLANCRRNAGRFTQHTGG